MAVNNTSYNIKKFQVGNYNISESIAYMKYYESVLSPAIIFEVIIAENEGILSGSRGGGGLVGGEECLIDISTSSSGSDEQSQFKFLEKGKLYLRTIKNADPSSQNNVYTLIITTSGALINETSRCSMRYEGKISDIVATIADNSFVNYGSGKSDFQVEETENTYSFIGNARKPFHTITWLAKKSIPIDGGSKKNTDGSAGFFFYEDRDGYKFRSVDNLCNTKNLKDSIPTFTQSELSEPNKDTRNKILSASFDTNTDILENLRLGMFSNVNYFWNALDMTTQCLQYNLNDNYANQMKTLESTASPYTVPLGLEQSPSRIMFSILDTGSLEKTGYVENVIDLIPNQPKYQAQSIVRYNLIFSQTVTITVPINTLLRIGNVIECQFLQTGGDGTDKLRSGNYLIAEISHQFSDNAAYTGLKLIRDSYSEV